MNWKFWQKQPDILQHNPARRNTLSKAHTSMFQNRFDQNYAKYHQVEQDLRKQIEETKQQQAEELRRAIASITAFYNTWGVFREGFDKADNDRLAQNPTYALCEKAVQDYFATVEWNIVDKEKNPLDDAIDFLEAPNGQETLNTLFKQSVRDVIRYDAGSWVNSITLGGELVEIKAYHGPEFWIEVDHDLTTAKGDQGIYYQGNWSHGFVKHYWQHSRLGVFQPFDPKEVTYFMMYPRSDSPYGTDFIQNLKWYLEYLLDSTKAAGMTFANGIMPGMAWYHPNITSAQDLEERRAEIDLELSGPDGFGGPIHLIGEEKIEQIVPKLIDLEWLKGQKFVSEIVWAMFGFSQSEFSSSDSTRATAYLQRNITKSRMLYPLLKMYETQITRNILPYMPGYHKGWKFEFIQSVDLDDDVKRSQIKQTRATTFVALRQGGLSPKMAAKISEIGDDLATTEVEELEDDFDQQGSGQDWMSQLYNQGEQPQEPDGVGMGGQAEDYPGTDNAGTVLQLGQPEPMQKAIRKGRVRRSADQNQRLDIYFHVVTNGLIQKGGTGSGDHGHAGRPGKIGGSQSDNQKKTLSRDVIDGINEGFSNIHQDSSIEKVLLISSDGKVIGTLSGDDSQVKISKQINLTNAHLVHNHPGELKPGLSDGDIITAINRNLHSITATGKEGSLTLERPESGWPKIDPEDIKSRYRVAGDELRSKMQERKTKGETISLEDVNKGIFEMVLGIIKDLGMEVRYVKRR